MNRDKNGRFVSKKEMESKMTKIKQRVVILLSTFIGFLVLLWSRR